MTTFSRTATRTFTTLLLLLPGCAAAPLALIGSVFGLAGSAVSTGSSVYKSGKLDSAERASLDEVRAAVFLAADDLRLENVLEKDEKSTRVIQFLDGKKAKLNVIIDPHTPTLALLRIDVGFSGNEPTARLMLARVRAHLPNSMVPSPGTPGEG